MQVAYTSVKTRFGDSTCRRILCHDLVIYRLQNAGYERSF